jgi:hypothetical protein
MTCRRLARRCRRPQPRLLASSLLAVLLLGVGAAWSRDTVLPGPAPRWYNADEAASGVLRCVGCHREIGEEWLSSRHAQSYRDPYFARALASEQVPFCRKCHAPDADPSQAPPRSAADNGVSCYTCHVTPHGAVGGRGLSAEVQKNGSAPQHDPVGDPRFAEVDACRNCHEFDFPTGDHLPALAAMQNTVGEHQRSRYAKVRCGDCHMRRISDSSGRLHADHRFRLDEASGLLAGAVAVELVARSAAELKIGLVPLAIGHSFPTGDLFRRAELRIWLGNAASARNSPPYWVYALERVYAFDKVRRTRRVASNTRLEPATLTDDGKRILSLTVPNNARSFWYELVWQRIPPGAGQALGIDAKSGDVVVSKGAL